MKAKKDIKITFRADEETAVELRKIGEKASAFIRAAVWEKIKRDRGYVPPEDEDLSDGPGKTYVPSGRRMWKAARPEDWVYPEQVENWDRLMLPVGDSIHIVGPWRYTMDPWPVAPHLHKKLETLFAPWAANGYVLVWGDEITEGCSCPNNRMQPYFPGDRPVWCEVTDMEKAAKFLSEDTQILVPLRADLNRMEDPTYASLYKTYHGLFVSQYYGRDKR